MYYKKQKKTQKLEMLISTFGIESSILSILFLSLCSYWIFQLSKSIIAGNNIIIQFIDLFNSVQHRIMKGHLLYMYALLECNSVRNFLWMSTRYMLMSNHIVFCEEGILGKSSIYSFNYQQGFNSIELNRTICFEIEAFKYFVLDNFRIECIMRSWFFCLNLKSVYKRKIWLLFHF